MLPLPSSKVLNANTIIGTHQQHVSRKRHHHVHIIVEQTLLVVCQMLIDGCGSADRTGDIDTTRVGTYHDVFPTIYQHGINAIAMQHAMLRLVGIEEQGASASAVTTNLINTLTINTNQHGIIVVRTNATDRITIQILIRYTHKLIGSNLAILTNGYHMKTILVTSNP